MPKATLTALLKGSRDWRISLFLFFSMALSLEGVALEDWQETPWEDPIQGYESFFIENALDSDSAASSAVMEQEPVDLAALEEPSDAEEIALKGESKRYRLKIGDKIDLSVYAERDTQREVTVDFNGEVNYLNVKKLPVRGKTIEEVRTELEKGLKSYYRDPLLIVTPVAFASESFVVMGEVRNPGVKPFFGRPTVLTALALGGGFTTRVFRNQTIDQSDLDHSFLSRKGLYLPVDFSALINEGDSRQDLPLEAGDYIYIAPRHINRVYVLGEVGLPSSVTFMDSLSLAEAIAEAGGTSRFASSRVAVIRGSLCCPMRFLVDFNRIMKGLAIDFPLMPGDIVFVPAMQYTTFKEIVKAAVASFVSAAFSIAGTNAFIAVHPHAAITGVITPAQFINTNAGIVTTPVAITTGVNP